MSDGMAIAKHWYARLDFPTEYQGEFDALTCDCAAPEAVSARDYTFSTDPADGGKNLLQCLYFCQELAREYAEKGIPEKILMDTLADIVIWTKIHHELTGSLGVLEVGWLKRHFQCTLFRLGRLQFELSGCNRDIPETGIRKDDPVLSVHIPRGGHMTPEECEASIAAAREFFPRYFPDWHWKCFTCFSWLLDDTLQQLMKPEANALQFQRRFRVVFRAESDDILKFIFRWDTRRENLHTLTPGNAFHRRVMDHVAGGGRFQIAFGYFL